jgi:allophanate hydrolase subunit 2
MFLAADYRVSPTSNRVGTRLDGPRLPAVPSRSRPMIIGAIEVPPDGAPIILGPEHPVTGGYAVVGVVAHDDLDAAFAIPLGGRIRFTAG